MSAARQSEAKTLRRISSLSAFALLSFFGCSDGSTGDADASPSADGAFMDGRTDTDTSVFDAHSSDTSATDSSFPSDASGVDTSRPDAGPPVGFFAAVDGRDDGDGSLSSPWDLQTAIGHDGNPPGVGPGARIWVRGGTYRGKFHARLEGSAAEPIHVRPYPGEHVRIDGDKNAEAEFGNSLTIAGAYTWYFDFEITSLDANEYRGGREGEESLATGSVATVGHHLKVIDFITHNSIGGPFSSANTSGVGSDIEFYGGASFAHGFRAFGSGRDHGHGAYMQNVRENDPNVFRQMLVFNNFSQSYQCRSSTGAAKASRCHVVDSIFYRGAGVFDGGGANPDNLPTDHRLNGNLLFHASWRFGQNALHEDNWAEGNTFVNSQLELNNITDLSARDNLFVRAGEGGPAYNVLQYIFNRFDGRSVDYFDGAVSFAGSRFEGPTRLGRGTDNFASGSGTTAIDWGIWNATHSGPMPADAPTDALIRTWKHSYLPGRGTVAIVRFDDREVTEVDLSALEIPVGTTLDIIWGLDPVLQGVEGVGLRVVDTFIYDGSAWEASLDGLSVAGRNGYEEPGIVQDAYDDDLFVFFVRAR